MEKRIIGAHELRSVETSKGLGITGYAARYNVLSHPLPSGGGKTFRERLAKRSFDGILSTSPDVVALINHNPNLIIGRTTSGTMRLHGDNAGLRFDVDLPNTSYSRDLHESIRRGDASSCSFSFGPFEEGDEEWTSELDPETRGPIAVRTIKNFRRLHDISVLTGLPPAYPGTSVDARNELVAAEVRASVERLLAQKPAPQKFYCPIFCRAIDELSAYNREHGTSLSLGDLHDLADRRRKRMLQDILD